MLADGWGQGVLLDRRAVCADLWFGLRVLVVPGMGFRVQCLAFSVEGGIRSIVRATVDPP